MTATPDDWEEMTEEQANEDGVFDCPTCGRLRNASELTREEADEWAASRGVKIVRT
jgi:hypothetical protein